MEAFYQIENTNQEGAMTKVVVQINSEHPIYKAHFPGYPITPGAMLVRMAIEIASGQNGFAPDANEVKNVKFLHPHIPTEQDHLTFSFVAGQNPTEVIIRQDEAVYAKMTLVFAD